MYLYHIPYNGIDLWSGLAKLPFLGKYWCIEKRTWRLPFGVQPLPKGVFLSCGPWIIVCAYLVTVGCHVIYRMIVGFTSTYSMLVFSNR